MGKSIRGLSNLHGEKSIRSKKFQRFSLSATVLLMLLSVGESYDFMNDSQARKFIEDVLVKLKAEPNQQNLSVSDMCEGARILPGIPDQRVRGLNGPYHSGKLSENFAIACALIDVDRDQKRMMFSFTRLNEGLTFNGLNATEITGIYTIPDPLSQDSQRYLVIYNGKHFIIPIAAKVFQLRFFSTKRGDSYNYFRTLPQKVNSVLYADMKDAWKGHPSIWTHPRHDPSRPRANGSYQRRSWAPRENNGDHPRHHGRIHPREANRPWRRPHERQYDQAGQRAAPRRCNNNYDPSSAVQRPARATTDDHIVAWFCAKPGCSDSILNNPEVEVWVKLARSGDYILDKNSSSPEHEGRMIAEKLKWTITKTVHETIFNMRHLDESREVHVYRNFPESPKCVSCKISYETLKSMGHVYEGYCIEGDETMPSLAYVVKST